jgi:hypothetical protein
VRATGLIYVALQSSTSEEAIARLVLVNLARTASWLLRVILAL